MREIFYILMTSIAITLEISGTGDTGKSCNEILYFDSSGNNNNTISSNRFPGGLYTPGLSFTWCVKSPEGTTISLDCDYLDIPKSASCAINALVVSLSEFDTRTYCGTNSFQACSLSNDMTITLHSSKKSRAGKFNCNLLVESEAKMTLKAVVYRNCECGYSFKMKIVGGTETGINEFPFMAGIIDARRGPVVICGAVIISRRYVLTAEHCLDTIIVEKTAIVVGEHDVSTGSDTSVTKLIKAKRFVHYPYYNPKTTQYDIALIELQSEITYSSRVGPVCLPFKSKDWDLTDITVTVLGWGTTEFGGPRSKVLQKADLKIVDSTQCINAYGANFEPYTQLCTYMPNKDACQYDSGGPLVWDSPYTGRWEVVGIVSYGKFCGSTVPGVNTRISPFMKWILDNTLTETYCSP